MQYRSRKLLSLLLALLMIVSLLPSAAFADEIDETPIEEVVEEVEETPVEETPVEETPVEEAPVEETPVEETPAEETPVEETPVEETPVEETPVEETLVEETPVEETPVEETLVEETPVEEAPVEETPVEEAPVEEAPVEETPVEEPEVDEAVAAVQALINALPDVSALEGLSADELVALDTQAGDAYDAYYELSEAQQAQITGLDNLLALLDYFTTLVTVEEETTTQPEGTVDFATFLSYLENGDVVNFDGSTVDEAVDGKLTVQWSPEDGEVQSNAAGNTPAKANNGNAQYIILSGKTNVTIKNVEFVYVPGDFTLTGNTGYAGSFTEEGVPNAQLYLENSGDTVIEDCSFEKVVFTSWSNTGKTEVKNCSFSDIYNSYAIKDLGGATASVTNCTFNNCGGGIMTNGNGDRSNVSTTLTISDNQFTNIDVENTAADDNVGNRGVLQFAENTTFAGLTVSDNTATNCGPILRQLSASAVNYVAANLDALEALAGESGTLYTNNTKDDHKPATPVEVDSYAALKVALADGKSVKLTADIDINEPTNFTKETTIDLNGHKLTVSDGVNSVSASVIFKDTAETKGSFVFAPQLTAADGVFVIPADSSNVTMTFEGVNVSGNNYSSCYGLFHTHSTTSKFVVNGGTWNLSGETSDKGGVFKQSNASGAALTITNATMTLTNVSRVTTEIGTTITNSTITIKGDSTSGTANMENAFNKANLTITNSNVTIDGLKGRGITVNEGQTVSINGSTVTVTNCEGATIKSSGTVTVDSQSTVTVDKAPIDGNKEETTIEGVTVTEKTYVAKIGETFYNSIDEAINVCKVANSTETYTIELLADCSTDSYHDFATDKYKNITIQFTTNVENGVTMTLGGDNDYTYLPNFTIGSGVTLKADLISVTLGTQSTVEGKLVTKGIWVQNGGKLTIAEGATLEKTSSDYAVHVKNGGTLTVKGTLTADTLQVWRDSTDSTGKPGALVIDGSSATVTVSNKMEVYDAADRTTQPKVTVQNGGKLTVNGSGIHANRGGYVFGSKGAINANVTLGYISGDDDNAGKLSILSGCTFDGTVTLAGTGSTASGVSELTLSDALQAKGSEGYQLLKVNGTWSYVIPPARIGETYYDTINNAINKAKDGEKVTVLANCTMNGAHINNKSITLDLNGCTVAANDSVSTAFTIYSTAGLTVKDSSEGNTGVLKTGDTVKNANTICVQGGTFTLESGTIQSANNAIYTSETEGSNITISGGKIQCASTTKDSAVMYLAKKSTVNITGGELSGYQGIAVQSDSAITISGGSLTASDSVAIYGQGDNARNATVTISGGTIEAKDDVAIYNPGSGSTLTITGGTITGTTAVYMKGGSLSISDGSLNATGEAAEYEAISAGFKSTGDALIVDNFGSAYGTPNVTITGGTFISKNNHAIASEANTNLPALTGFVSGGTFKGEETLNDTLAAEGCEIVANDDGSYCVEAIKVAQIGTTKYETLAAAFEAAKTGDTIELLKDVELTKGITISTGGITFDGNNHKLTGNIKNLGGWDCVVLNYETPEATAGAKITDLTIEMTAAWGIHFNGSGTTCPELNNVTVEGTYTAPFGLYLRNNGGAKLTNCNIVSMFTNSGRSSDNDKLTLDGTHIDTLFVNTTTATTTKVFVNDTGDTKSSVGALYLADDSTMRLDSSAQSLSTEENTTYSVFYNGEVKQYVAKIGNNYYFSLEKAVAAAQTSDTITLLRDVTVTETTEIPSTISNLTIEGQNHTITADKSSDANLRVFNFVNSKNPTIRNLKITGSAYYGIELNGCGQSTLENVTVEGEYTTWNEVPLALYVQNTGGASLKDCSFVGVGKNGNGLISETNDQRLKLDSTTIEKLYVNATEVVYEDVVYLAEGEEHTSKINTICCGDYSSIRVSAALCERAGSILLKSYDESVLFVSPAAKIDTVYYSTLSDAVAALEDSDTLTLLQDIEVNADNKDKNRIKLESLKGVTIDGNGKIFTVDLDGNSYCLMFTGTTDLTVKNLTVTGEVNYAIFIKSCVNTTLENVKVDTTSNGLGDDDNVYAVTFNYTGGGTLKNCEINGVFKNGEGVTANGTDGRLKLENSTIGNLYVHYTKGDGYLNKENLTAGANDKSKIENLILGYGDTSRVSYDVTKNAENIVTAVALVTYANNSTEAFFTLPEAVAAVEGQSTATITLLRDAKGAGVVFENENKVGKHNNLTIDFNGFTYTVTGPSVGSTKTETNAFQILEGNTVTLKNGKLTCTATSESGCKRLIQNYANLTLEDMEFDGTSISDPDNKVYALSFCCGTVNIIGNTSITANSDAMAFDSDQYSTYDAPVVTVNTTGTITGDVAVTGGTLNISNGTFNGSLSKSAGTIAISGGTFATEIQDDWCAEGFEPVELSDGTYSVQVETAKTGEAAIGSKVYATFAEALEAAKTDYETNGTISNIQILAAVTVSDAIGFPVSIVNSGGYTITGEIKAADGYILTSMGSQFYMIVVDENKKVASVGEKRYNSLQEALNAAAESATDKTVTLLEDVTDNTVYIIDEGVTLDLGTHSLTAKALNGDGSVTGTAYNDKGGYAKLTVDSLILATQAPKTTANDASYDTLPVYNPSEKCYVFTFFKVVEQEDGFQYDAESDKLSYSFGRQLTGLVRTALLKDGASDNKLSIEVHVSWTDESGNTATTIYDYKDNHVSEVMNDNSRVFGLILKGLKALELSSGATVQAVVKADSGVTTCGEQHTITF